MNSPETLRPEQRWAEQPTSSDEIDLREILAVLLAGKWWIAGITTFGLALSLAYAFLATPIYRADAMLQIQQQNSPLSTLGSQNEILSALLGANTQAQAEIQIMTSRAVVDPVIRNMNLNVKISGTPYGSVRLEELDVPDGWLDEKLWLRSKGGGAYTLKGPNGQTVLTGRLGHQENSESGTVSIRISRLAIPSGTTATIVREPVQEAFHELSKRLSAVELGTDTGIVQMSLEGAHPAVVRNILNALVAQYLNQNVAAYSAQARRSLAFVNKQLPALKAQMNHAESRLTDYQVSHNTVNLDEQAKALLQEFNALEAEMSQLRLARAALGERYTSRFPASAALNEEEQSVRGRISKLQDQLKQLPKDEQGYVRLKRDAEVYTTLYTTLLTEKQDLGIAAAGAVGSARVVDYAVTPLKPVKPKKILVIVIGTLLGMFAGIGIVFLRRVLSSGLVDALEIEQRFGLPTYAVIPHSSLESKLNRRRHGGAGMPATILAQAAPRDPAVEGIRSLRTSLEFAMRDARNRFVGISGPTPGVGKSFVAANLAYVSAEAGDRTLLVDCDLRRGHLQRYVGQPYAPGMSELLTAAVPFEQCVRRGLLDTEIDFVSAGRYPPNPAELFVKHDIGSVLERIGDGYDLVLVDLPPLLSVVDRVIAMRGTGVNLLVFKAGKHSESEIAHSLIRIRQSGVAVAGFLLNDLTRQAASYRYGSSAYNKEYS